MKRSMEVEIYGQTFTVNSENDEQYVQKIASVVDQRMRQMAGNTKVTVPLRVAIMAALSMADELEVAKSDEQDKGIIEEAERISNRVLALLEQAELSQKSASALPLSQSTDQSSPPADQEEKKSATLAS